MREPQSWFGSGTAQPKKAKSANASWWDGFFWGAAWGDGEGFLIGIGIVVALVLLLGLVWFLFEIGIPVILFLLYFVTRGMLARVVNDRHHCRHRLVRSLAWAFLWASVYTAPLAGAVWAIHAQHARGSIVAAYTSACFGGVSRSDSHLAHQPPKHGTHAERVRESAVVA